MFEPPRGSLPRGRARPPTGALGAWFKERYEPHPTRVKQQKGFSFWVRRGGTLQRRLLAEARE